MEHRLIHRAPYICGKVDDPQQKMYDLNVISEKDLSSSINRGNPLHNNVLLSKQYLFLNLFFGKVVKHLMAFQGFPQFPST